ncbi:phospholipase D-like domain-containing protein [Aromatoleum anaerobium]|nr:phospholipase D-like domain-containing protein [Aromatoleum anaerobium]MCK0508671.1 phospholipase D-like domain-containing protein [Aromatoleum anaerobium]
MSKRMLWTAAITAAGAGAVALVAMNFSTPEKKLEQVLAHRFAVATPQFRREMSVLLGPPIIAGNRVTALQNGDEIFPAMLQAIRGARASITFETYIYWSGEIGREFSDALAERAQAGIPVHVTIDWAGSIKMDERLLRKMEQAGVRVHRYRPLHWYSLDRLNNRTHRKLLVVDGRIGFTGGVGIADQWLGHAQDPEHWRDSHYRIEGPAVAQMQAAFNDNWIKTTGEVLSGPAYFPELSPVGDVAAHLFLASPSGGSESMHLMYMMAVTAAKHSIDLAASYFVPDELIVKALIAARQRGVRIRVLLPGPYIDSDAVRFASKAGWGPLLHAGIEIHEYQPTMLHTKLLVVDREVVSVGSTNFDIRSFRLNDEASLNLYDRPFAEKMIAVFEADLAQAQRYTYEMWQQRPMKDKLVEKFVLPLKSQL